MRVAANQEGVVILSTRPNAGARSFRTHLERPSRLAASEARALLGSAWTALAGQAPDPKTTALLTAHWALETDAGRAMPGHNFAGIKAGPAAPGAVYRTVEGHGSTQHEVEARFRAYDSAEAGARDYVGLLQRRYPAALEAARQGDAQGFAHELACGGYFTADPKAYAHGLQQRLAELEGAAPLASTPPQPAETANRIALSGLLHAFRASSEHA